VTGKLHKKSHLLKLLGSRSPGTGLLCRTVRHNRGGLQIPGDPRLPLWRGAVGGGVLAGTRRPSAAGDGVPTSLQIPPHTHTARSLACPLLTLSSARPFSNGIFRSNGAPASLPPASSYLTHARRMDGFCNQNADQLGSLAGLSLLTNCICRCSRMRARLSLPPRPPTSHMHAGWMVSATKTPTSSELSRRTVPSNCICRRSKMRARLPLHILLLHTQVSR
jgi:hypothetical protein